MNYYNEIKTELIKNEEYQKVKDYSKNRNDLMTYYKVGKLLSEAGKHYGKGIIKEYSKRLSFEINKKYNVSSLRYMRQFYHFIQKHQLPVGELMWSHYVVLLPIKDTNEVNYYINVSKKENLSRNALKEKVKSNEYNRLTDSAKKKLIKKEKLSLEDSIKDPIIIRGKVLDIKSEHELKLRVLEDIEYFMKQLGSSYAFIGSEYKIKVVDTYDYIDILLFNLEKNCYVVCELKITEEKKEHLGQVQVYMKAVDKELKSPFQNDTEGILITKKNNKLIPIYIENDKLHSREYKLLYQ